MNTYRASSCIISVRLENETVCGDCRKWEFHSKVVCGDCRKQEFSRKSFAAAAASRNFPESHLRRLPQAGIFPKVVED
ncbi:MAG: hypothetical protein LBS54_08485 [Dysgonamonadaceae bacterium]|nr:hypothetical protein [Dysgonamonadaceae bacterium]